MACDRSAGALELNNHQGWHGETFVAATLSRRVKDFVESMRFGTSAPGNYIFMVQMPLTEATVQGAPFEDVPELDVVPKPFACQMSRMTYEVVTTARTAAE